MFKKLARPDEPWVRTGSVILFKGDTWRQELKNTYFKAGKVSYSHIVVFFGGYDHIFAPLEKVDIVKWDQIIQPTRWRTAVQVRLGFPDNNMIHYPKYLEGQFRGVLEQGGYDNIDLTDNSQAGLEKQAMAGMGYGDSPWDEPRFQFWYTYGKFPAIAVKNFGPEYEKGWAKAHFANIDLEEITKPEDLAMIEKGEVAVETVLAETEVRW